MGSQSARVPHEFCADLATAIHPYEHRQPNDIDIAVTGLSGRAFLHAYGVLLGTLDHPFDLVELDASNRFSQRLRERGELERVG